MIIKDAYLYGLASRLPFHSFARWIAKRIFKGFTIKQSLYSGIICLDAVEHSWAWLGKVRYQTFDRDLQDKLLFLSSDYDLLIDIGCNVGTMALSLLLRNPKIKAVCFDPNHRAISLLKKSVSLNHLNGRVAIIEAAVSNKDGVEIFDAAGSVMGHISNLGRPVKCVDFVSIINQYASDTRCLIKLDVEGFEGVLMGEQLRLKHLENLCLVIELHPYGFYRHGNPEHCLKMLLESGAKVIDLQDKIVTQVARDKITQVIARWPHA